MKTPTKINNLDLENTCTSVSFGRWEQYMQGTVKANGAQIKSLIKKHLPDLYYDLALEYRNPYENRSVKKEGLLVYVHSGIEYFLRYS